MPASPALHPNQRSPSVTERMFLTGQLQAPTTAPQHSNTSCNCSQISQSLILEWNVFHLVLFLFVLFWSQSPGQLCMDTSWWSHWGKLGVCCWLSLDCCINLSALQYSTTSLPLLFSLPPPPFLNPSLSLSLFSITLHSHTAVLEHGSGAKRRSEGGSVVNKELVSPCLYV